MKVGICSLGCKVNIYESELVTNILKNNNYTVVDFEDKADIYIINTCSVTNESDKKSRKMINRAKKNNPAAIIIVMGCYSQVNAEDIDVDIVLGNKDKSKIVEIIEEYIKTKQKKKIIYDLTKVDFEKMEITNFDSHTRAFVKIQDGCNAFCSYCIIPYVRGRVRSKDPEDVIKEVTTLVEKGYKEIVLTGIHTGRYGTDINTTLEELLNKLVNIPNIYRIRLSSIEINEITPGIKELLKEKLISSAKEYANDYDKYFFDGIKKVGDSNTVTIEELIEVGLIDEDETKDFNEFYGVKVELKDNDRIEYTLVETT